MNINRANITPVHPPPALTTAHVAAFVQNLPHLELEHVVGLQAVRDNTWQLGALRVDVEVARGARVGHALDFLAADGAAARESVGDVAVEAREGVVRHWVERRGEARWAALAEGVEVGVAGVAVEHFSGDWAFTRAAV